MDEDQKQLIGKVLGKIPSGVFVLTAKHNSVVSAMLASWVQQAGFDPPAVSIALAKGRPIAKLIGESKRLALSILPDEDKTLMKHYARLKFNEDPFAGIKTKPSPSGVPILSDALAYLDCRLLGTHDFGGDHELFVAEIVSAAVLREGAAFTHQRGNGFHY